MPHKIYYSNQIKIEPKLSDDWQIESINESFTSLFSKKLNQTIINIPSYRILSFIVRNNYNLKGRKIEGILSVLIGKELVNKEEYNERINNIEEETIPYSSLKIGQGYKTKKGRPVIYLGARYISTIKADTEEKKIDFTNITKKHFFQIIIKTKSRHSSYEHLMGGHIISSKQHILEEYNGEEINTREGRIFKSVILKEDRIEELFQQYYNNNPSIVYLSNTMKYNPEHILVPLNENQRKGLFALTSEGLVGEDLNKLNKKINKKRFNFHSSISKILSKISLKNDFSLYNNDFSINENIDNYDRLEILEFYRIEAI